MFIRFPEPALLLFIIRIFPLWTWKADTIRKMLKALSELMLYGSWHIKGFLIKKVSIMSSMTKSIDKKCPRCGGDLYILRTWKNVQFRCKACRKNYPRDKYKAIMDKCIEEQLANVPVNRIWNVPMRIPEFPNSEFRGHRIPGTQYLIIDDQNEMCDIILHGKNSENSSARIPSSYNSTGELQHSGDSIYIRHYRK